MVQPGNPTLLDPITLGPRQAPNRVMFGPHETNLGWGRSISDRHAAYYQARALGGAGIIVTEEASVHESDWPYERSPLATESTQGWDQIVARCRPRGSLVLAGLGHAGGQGSSSFHQRPMWSPSDEPEVNSREVPKIMEIEDIDAVIAGFGDAARLAAASDLDGVEINAGQHSLIRQFLSGLTNRRGDQYGTDRTLFAREVLAAVRAKLGPDRILGLRLSCDEMAPWAGITPEAAADLAEELAPLIDYLVVVRGSIFSVPETRPTLHHGTGFNLDTAGLVRSRVSIPVFVQGSIIDVGQAEWAIGDQRCDGVEMTRALIADPDLPAKHKAGLDDQIRPCVLCNQLCRVRDNRNPIIGCVTDPRSGHETTDPLPSPSASGTLHSVLVIGGGPAGLEAARTAAVVGHSVRLVERSPHLGGMARVAAIAPAHSRFGDLVSWLESECRRLGVQIETGTELDAAEIEAWDGDVILATGGQAGPQGFTADSAAVVVTADEYLEGAELPDGTIAVWDPLGGSIGVAVSEHLAEAGRPVVHLTSDNHVGNMLALTGDLAGSNVRLQQKAVEIVRRVRLRSVAGTTLHLTNRFTEEASTIEAAAVIDCGHRIPDETLWSALSRATVRVGDAIAPRTVGEAIREGREAALGLEGLIR